MSFSHEEFVAELKINLFSQFVELCEKNPKCFETIRTPYILSIKCALLDVAKKMELKTDEDKRMIGEFINHWFGEKSPKLWIKF